MKKTILSYFLCTAIVLGISCPAPIIAMEEKENEKEGKKAKARFISAKEFHQKLQKFGKVTQQEARFLLHWGKKQYNHKFYGGPATTAEENRDAKRIMLTKGIPAAAIATLIIAATTAVAVKTGFYFRNKKRKEAEEKRAIQSIAENTKAANARKATNLEKVRSIQPDLETSGNFLMKSIGRGESLQRIKQDVLLDSTSLKEKDANGVTPLMVAVVSARPDVVNYLVDEQRVPVNPITNGNLTALDMAQLLMHYHEEMAENTTGREKKAHSDSAKKLLQIMQKLATKVPIR